MMKIRSPIMLIYMKNTCKKWKDLIIVKNIQSEAEWNKRKQKQQI